MEKLNLQPNQKRNELLNVVLFLFIFSGSIFDVSDLILNTSLNSWYLIHYSLKDVQTLAISILAFTLCPYNKINIKVLTFMLVIWRTVVLIYNISLPKLEPGFLYLPLYAIYIFWITRVIILYFKDKPPVYPVDYIEPNYFMYNVLIPISSFRGLLQALFTLKNPRYEARLMLYKDKVYSVYKNRFTEQQLDINEINDLVSKAGAKIKNRGIFNADKFNKIQSLIGKRSITGFRDCRRLEI